MDINQAIGLARVMLSEHIELYSWKVATNKRKRSFGMCNYKQFQIELSTVLVPLMTDKAINDTIIHEIAHALTRGQGHDRVWKRKCLELGGNGQRCGGPDHYKEDLVEKREKYTLTCPVCNHKTQMSRLPKRSYSCGEHGFKSYNPEYKLIITKNY